MTLVLVVLAAAAAVAGAPAEGNCVDVQIGSARKLDLACLNRALSAQTTAARRRTAAAETIDHNSNSAAVGTYNEAGYRLQMGTSAGVSGRPQRPPAPVYKPVF